MSAEATSVRGWPFGVGVLAEVGATPCGADRDEQRLAVALSAYKAGYFLLAILDLADDEPFAGSSLDPLRALVMRTDAEALFVLGMPTGGLEAMAAELRLVIRQVEQPLPSARPHEALRRAGDQADRASRRTAVLTRDARLLGQLRAAHVAGDQPNRNR